MNKIERVIASFRKKINEEAVITNSLSGGRIAGTSQAGDNPPVSKKNHYIYAGRNSRKKWLDYLKLTKNSKWGKCSQVSKNLN
jgi:hypothetical protein